LAEDKQNDLVRDCLSSRNPTRTRHWTWLKQVLLHLLDHYLQIILFSAEN